VPSSLLKAEGLGVVACSGDCDEMTSPASGELCVRRGA
jgi:hypothetical protein